jgi:hypothetical protein
MIFVIDILVELHQELADHLEDHAGLGQCRQLIKKKIVSNVCSWYVLPYIFFLFRSPEKFISDHFQQII